MAFGELQKRIGRKKVTAAIRRSVPVRLIAYDLLEYRCQDVRRRPLAWRSAILKEVVDHVADEGLMVSQGLESDSWDQLARKRAIARRMGVEGLMLKHIGSTCQAGRKRGEWWKWKTDPYSVDAVMIYAQRGHGRRSGLYTDYTLAIWKDGSLAPFAKAYSGLKDPEIRDVDRFVRRNTLERYGPVRSVKPELVFEIAFDDIRESRRHKSGVAVRFPRIARWRKDKNPEEADTIDTVYSLIEVR
jgi:DNA ligase-1